MKMWQFRLSIISMVYTVNSEAENLYHDKPFCLLTRTRFIIFFVKTGRFTASMEKPFSRSVATLCRSSSNACIHRSPIHTLSHLDVCQPTPASIAAVVQAN